MRSLFLPVIALLALPNAGLADPPAAANEVAARSLAPGGMPIAAADKPWSVVGAWSAIHTVWKGTITLLSNGEVLNPENKPDGQWVLTAEQGQLHLILRWRKSPADDLSMVNANEFYGTDGRSEFRLHREPTPAMQTGGQDLGGAVEFHSWHQGEPAVKLIRRDEGFCALTSVTGHFAGSGELVEVYLAEDDYWYLGGRSQQNDVAAGCIVVRYRSKENTRPGGSDETVVPLK